MTDQYFLSKGAHARAADGRCAMEWVAYIAGEKHSDHCGEWWLRVDQETVAFGRTRHQLVSAMSLVGEQVDGAASRELAELAAAWPLEAPDA